MKTLENILDKYIDNSHAHNEITDEWDNEYNLELIEANFPHSVRFTNGTLVLDIDDISVKYFLIERNWSSDEFPIGFGNMVFYGNGFSGSLMEMRHTYFNPYLFYINAKLIEEAFTELRKYFEI